MLANPVVEAVDSIASALGILGKLDRQALNAADVLDLAERCETLHRCLTVTRYDLAYELSGREAPEVGKRADEALANQLRISKAEAKRRIRTVEPLTATTTLTGQPLGPRQPNTAEAWRAGELDTEHVSVIQKFLKKLPNAVPADDREYAEKLLAHHALELCPDQLCKLAEKLTEALNPDGIYDDEDRARKRGFTWVRQDADGMSYGQLWATPETRAYYDALFAKHAAPGVNNPADETPSTSGTPSEAAITADTRTRAQRQHDALAVVAREHLGNPTLGQHNGLPVTVIATATVQDLAEKTGYATTAAGTRLPITDLIRMASHAYLYLALFDGVTNRPLYLGRTKRIASADQRLVLHATDRGCTYPGCTVPGYLTEVHHLTEWSQGGLTNIDNLTFACGPHHRLIKPGGWTTRKTILGHTEWIPPPGMPCPVGTNYFHHPERLLADDVGRHRQPPAQAGGANSSALQGGSELDFGSD